MNSSLLQLGEVSEPLLLFGGPYSNLQATQAMRCKANELNIPPQRTICTGDVVAYCGSPNETIAELRQWGCHVLLGNCEESLGQQASDCHCGFSEGTACSLLSVQWYQYASAKLTKEERAWMLGLPRLIKFQIGQLKAAVVHGAATGINRFIFASLAASELFPEFAKVDADLVIAGHSGIPFTRQFRTASDQVKIWHNAGVIGMPANDGQATVWYSLIVPQKKPLFPTIRHVPLSYASEAAQAAMYKAGLANGYAEALSSGLWPSMDVLPESERKQRGRPLVAAALISEIERL
jgi:predicted phosphodiesterase